jgi:hypothetical protein
MDDSDKSRFGTAIGAMLVTFGQEASTPRLLGYWMGLRDLPLAQVEAAVAKAMATAHKLPVPAELRDMAAGGDSQSRAIAAWSDVQRAVSVSYMVDLDFGDWVINAVIRNLGGRWNFFERLCAGAESEKWLRIEFMRTYQTYANCLPSDEMVRPLIGQATHGEVAGRSHTPQLITIAADTNRLALLPPRAAAAISDRKPINAVTVNFANPYQSQGRTE